jgi:hypothetical protein
MFSIFTSIHEVHQILFKSAGVKLNIVLPCFHLKLNVPIAALKIEASGSFEMLIPLYKSNVLVLQRNIISTIYSA